MIMLFFVSDSKKYDYIRDELTFSTFLRKLFLIKAGLGAAAELTIIDTFAQVEVTVCQRLKGRVSSDVVNVGS